MAVFKFALWEDFKGTQEHLYNWYHGFRVYGKWITANLNFFLFKVPDNLTMNKFPETTGLQKVYILQTNNKNKNKTTL